MIIGRPETLDGLDIELDNPAGQPLIVEASTLRNATGRTWANPKFYPHFGDAGAPPSPSPSASS